eukprot:scaffold13486_cov55-Phaeocystis_antarctica.AAC.1
MTATCKKRAVVESNCHRLCCTRSRVGGNSRTPARAIKTRSPGARPRATDQQLVGVGQGVCVLPNRKEGPTMRGEAWAGGGWEWAGGSAQRHAREEGPAVKAGGL